MRIRYKDGFVIDIFFVSVNLIFLTRKFPRQIKKWSTALEIQ